MTEPVGHWRATYTPGDSIVLSGPTSLVLLEQPGPAPASMIAALWEEVVGSSSMTDLAARLASFKIDALPSFGAFFWTGSGMRSLVRGSVRITDPATGAIVADGEGIQTWTEVGLGQLSRVVITAGDSGRSSPDGAVGDDGLPMVVGAARASSVSLDATENALVFSPQVTAGRAAAGEAEGEPVEEAAGAASIETAPSVQGSPAVGDADAVPGARRAWDGEQGPPAREEQAPAGPPEPVSDARAPVGVGSVPAADADVAGAAAGAQPAPEPAGDVPEEEDLEDQGAASVAVAAPPRAAGAPPTAPYGPGAGAQEGQWGFWQEEQAEPSSQGTPELSITEQPTAEMSFTDLPTAALPAAEMPAAESEPAVGAGSQPTGPAGSPPAQAAGSPPAQVTGSFEDELEDASTQLMPAPFDPNQFDSQSFESPVLPQPSPPFQPPLPPQQVPLLQPPPPQQPPPPVFAQPGVPQPMVPPPPPMPPPPTSPAPVPPLQPPGPPIQPVQPPAPPMQPVPAFQPSPGDPMIMAVDCPYGHSNPPNAVGCRVCGTPIPPQAPRLIGRPVLAVLHASDGGMAELDRAVLVGRAPDPSRSASRAPRLLTVQSPGHDISRTHVEIAPDGWQIVVTDLHSTNGTTLVRPGGYDQQRLTPGEPVPVQLGSVLGLGDGVSVAIGPPQ